MLLTTIPTDLIHDIFLMLDDRTTLAAFIATNRLLHEIFKAHPNAILRQVICNETGMDIRVFPYAWASVNSEYELETEESQESLISFLTPRKFTLLKDTHTTVQALSKHYSIRFKEGRILHDILTAEESRRFHIAACLFFHYQTIWSAFQEYAWEIPDDDDSQVSIGEVEAREDDVQDAKTTEACDRFLASLSTDELLWIQEFSDFLLDDIDCTLNLKKDPTYFARMGFTTRNAVNLSLDSWRHFLLSTGGEFLGSWQNDFFHNAPTHLQRKELWLTDAISRALQARAFRTEAKDHKILMSRGILIPACQKCGQQPVRRLFFNKTNLEEFATHWSYTHFPGEMSLNPVETGRAYRRVHRIVPPAIGVNFRERLVVIREIMAHAEAQAASLHEVSGNDLVVSDDEDDEGESDHPGAKTATAACYKWSPDDVLCLSCFSAIFSELYYAWWLEERQTDRVEAHTFPEEWCWWGNECRTQRRRDHASRRDHCCPRTKGVIS